MKAEESKRIVVITIVISLLFVIILSLRGVNLGSFAGIKAASSATLILTVWWWFYFKYGWKIKWLNLILYKENINGTWFGEYQSTDLSKGNIYTGQISLVIKQNYLTIKITSITERYKNYSYSEELNFQDEKNRLIYVYSQEKLSPINHITRKGTSELELTLSDDKSVLDGKFYTNNGTIGSLVFTKISHKHIMFFDKAKEMFEESVTK
ncbi:hypothetical protein P9D43_20795 [Neobacillus niacini]|uniref:Cap15 family cyclic dinucleotide receptor domain-containing protein n=1 Tax=Neobacillus niacini TaxID=86668 RepID=UPI0007AB21E8|nr:hypothetical protein [Neobacillus niacini]MEC1524444.1 hypothetical protein [Neobacillus niacini]